MQLARFLNKVFKKGGFVLTDANSKEYIIGQPNDNPIKLKILNSLPDDEMLSNDLNVFLLLNFIGYT